MNTSDNTQTGSRHADLAIQYWMAAKTNPREWENWQSKTSEAWQVKTKSSSSGWKDLKSQPHFFNDMEYRRKPITMMVGDVEVPKPLDCIKEGEECWIVGIDTFVICCFFNSASEYHVQLLKDGLLHETREDANIHSNAIRKLLGLPAGDRSPL